MCKISTSGVHLRRVQQFLTLFVDSDPCFDPLSSPKLVKFLEWVKIDDIIMFVMGKSHHVQNFNF